MEKQKANRIVLIANLVYIAIGFIASSYVIITEKEITKVLVSIFDIALLSFSAIYVYKECTKSAAKFYKMFCCLFSLRIIISIVMAPSLGNIDKVTYINDKYNYFLDLMLVIPYAPIIMITTINDLGEKKSTFLCNCILVIYSILFIGAIVLYMINKQSDFILLIIKSGMLLLYASILSVMTTSKYLDKKQRGTK